MVWPSVAGRASTKAWWSRLNVHSWAARVSWSGAQCAAARVPGDAASSPSNHPLASGVRAQSPGERERGPGLALRKDRTHREDEESAILLQNPPILCLARSICVQHVRQRVHAPGPLSGPLSASRTERRVRQPQQDSRGKTGARWRPLASGKQQELCRPSFKRGAAFACRSCC